jgi:hypothetical protein
MNLIQKITCGFLFMAALGIQNRVAAQVDPYQPPVVVTPPDWAPPYENPSTIQYYYIPDIECYYDVWNHEFAYMEYGRWVFSPVLPPMYASYDLIHGHVVILDRRVHQPWMHHELYVSHYPRYYHHEMYPGREGYSRPYGYDENARKPIYAPNRDADRHEYNHPERSEPVHYRDKNVGQPVRVEKNMMRPNNSGPNTGPRR